MMISEFSFYVDNLNLYEIWFEIYYYRKFLLQDYWVKFWDEGGVVYCLFFYRDGEYILFYYCLVCF